MKALVLLAAPIDLSYGTGALELQRLAAVSDATLWQQVLACAKSDGVTRVERRGSGRPREEEARSAEE